jgi:hypothetical protein
MKPVPFGLNASASESASKKNIEHAVANALERTSGLRPEFINRIEQKIIFSSLDDEQIGETLRRYVARQNKNYRKQSGIEVTLSPELIKELVESCESDFEDRRLYNARPVIQKYKRMIEGRIAQACAEGGIPAGSHVYGALLDKEASNQPVEERIDLWRAKDKSLIKDEAAIASKKAAQEKNEEVKPAAINRQLAIGAAAAIGIVSIFVGDYLSSRSKSRRAW